MDKQLHIVSFDVPWPANYGGVIDVFYKLRALHKAGVVITLHCFEYGEREQSALLEKYCDTIHYYKRLTGMQGVSLLRPYIVNSRKSSLLLKNLLKNKAPILFEGLHSCYYLNHPQLSDRKKYVRTHNVEDAYYEGLALSEQKWWRKLYYQFEAKLLKQYEIILNEANALLAISESDTAYFLKLNDNTIFVPAFHANDMVYSQLGDGDYCLFHGNLSVAENNEAAKDLVENVFSKLERKVIIAGAKPSTALIELIEQYEHIELIANPVEDQMLELKRDAHVHVLYSGQDTGTKLKLIDSLSQGRFVVANKNILIDDALKAAAIEANDWSEYIEVIEDLFIDFFKQEDIDQREEFLQAVFSNKENANKIIELVYAK